MTSDIQCRRQSQLRGSGSVRECPNWGYQTEASALNGVESMKKNPGADVVDLTEES